jgi:hypothetical protein
MNRVLTKNLSATGSMMLPRSERCDGKCRAMRPSSSNIKIKLFYFKTFSSNQIGESCDCEEQTGRPVQFADDQPTNQWGGTNPKGAEQIREGPNALSLLDVILTALVFVHLVSVFLLL